ncbi:hypothetical protein QSV34_02510 [Porticoccus sp. W117]|uniref:hypothetical protein n=1 Tax=Porticoccus sp. W117 TaxID=3054777 RepID=UPI0025947402|nr:hypothetical protein [Porticoccus sp. W117]MDM3870223.1 hypothetical protein [Porticoccus sp. W117]
MKNVEKSPLSRLWDWFCKFTGIVSLSSFAENLFKQLLEWKGFINVLLESYRSIVEPMFLVLTEWLSFSLPLWIGDYVVLGTIVTSSYFRIALKLANPSLSESIKKDISRPNGVFLVAICILGGIGTFFAMLCLWPIILLASAHSANFGRKGVHYDLWRGTWQLLCAIFFGCVILLAVNSQLS